MAYVSTMKTSAEPFDKLHAEIFRSHAYPLEPQVKRELIEQQRLTIQDYPLSEFQRRQIADLLKVEEERILTKN
jgi:hypothetical protein